MADLVIDIDVDDESAIDAAIQRAVATIIAEIEGTSFVHVLGIVAKACENWHREYFDKAQDPSGQPWAPLSRRTIQRKGHDTILIDTRALINSLGMDGAQYGIRRQTEDDTESVLVYGTNRPWAWTHMVGRDHPPMPARPFMGLTDQHQKAICERIADEMILRNQHR